MDVQPIHHDDQRRPQRSPQLPQERDEFGPADAPDLNLTWLTSLQNLKNGNIQGNSLYIYRKTIAANSFALPIGGFLPAGGYNWIIKSNAMSGMTMNCTTTTPKICTASVAFCTQISEA